MAKAIDNNEFHFFHFLQKEFSIKRLHRKNLKNSFIDRIVDNFISKCNFDTVSSER